jgi:hypothetical protein
MGDRRLEGRPDPKAASSRRGARAGRAGGTGCLDALCAEFLERGSPKELNLSCLAKIRRGPFPLTSPLRKRIAMDDAELARFAGHYVAEGTPLEAKVDTAGGKLRAAMLGRRTFILVPVGPATFQVAGALGFFVWFESEPGKPLRLRVQPPGGEEILLVARPVTPER